MFAGRHGFGCAMRDASGRDAVGHYLKRFLSLHPKLIDLSLGRIERLLAALGHPEQRLPPVIHIAGTNGKGSVVAYLSAILEAAGLHVHRFTSPHLVRFNERIMLAGDPGPARPISDVALADVLARVEAANAGEPITFFEITTAAAFLAFAEHPADIVILETGLGGRLDATNVLARPALTVITPIGYDHQEFLGSTLEAIASEKAGIIKKGVACVVGPQSPESYGVIAARAHTLKAPLFAQGVDWDAYGQHGRMVFQADALLQDLPAPRLIGPHQILNAGIAIAACHALEGWAIPDAAIARGLLEARWPARLDRLSGGPLSGRLVMGSELWLDGGHNPSGAAALAQSMAAMAERADRPLVLITGMLTTKDAAGFFAPFAGLAERVLTVPIPDQTMAFDADALAAIARGAGLPADPATGITEAIQTVAEAQRPVRVLICGSLYLAGHVLKLEPSASYLALYGPPQAATAQRFE